MAPPLTFTLSQSTSWTLPQDITTEANASLTSKRSMSSMVIPALARTLAVAAIGPSRW